MGSTRGVPKGLGRNIMPIKSRKNHLFFTCANYGGHLGKDSFLIGGMCPRAPCPPLPNCHHIEENRVGSTNDTRYFLRFYYILGFQLVFNNNTEPKESKTNC